jgi:putative FmdB family regulatory protein
LALTYHYRCQQCQHEFQARQSIVDDPLTDCLECGTATLQRVVHAVEIFTEGEPKTLGHLADRNTDKLGQYERQEKEASLKARNREGLAQLGVDPTPNPWWRRVRNTPSPVLAAASPQQKREYITKGTTPSANN